MPYPNSSDVASGQPTAAAHYNNLRKDAVYLGNVSADSVNLATFLQSFVLNMNIEYLAVARLRVPFDSQKPASVMISGCMLVQTANIDLPAGQFSGGAAVWYIFANRAPGVTSFTLTVNTSPVPGADQKLIGECYWNGTAIAPLSIRSYSNGGDTRLPAYDSGWFACSYNNTYAKAHGLGQFPRECIAFYSATNDNSTYRCGPISASNGTNVIDIVYWDATNVYIKNFNHASAGAIACSAGNAGSGYYRIFAWV